VSNGDTERFRRVQLIFDAAIDLPEDQRVTFVREQCGDDGALLREVTDLVEADAKPTWTASGATPNWLHNHTLPPGTTIGSFTIVDAIGEGGMGCVYRATQERPQRTVALKTLRAGTDSPKARRRFEYESEMLGRLQHPGIAQIHEAGTYRAGDRDVPFLAMELLEGARDLDDYVEQEELMPRELLSLFADVCDAVQHAHQHGIVHRDLKPSNLLVDANGRVKVIDFGIAMAMDTDEVRRTLRTETGVLLGTIAYMSPEQLDPDGGSPDARTDVYSLGILMFQLLTGRLPHDVDTLPVPTAMTVISQKDVPRLATYGVRHSKNIARELDWILLKATERDVNHRYQTVAELAADVRRFLADKPLEVGPPSTTYRVRKFVRRHRAAVAGTTIALSALIIGTITTAMGWHRAVHAESVTEQKRSELEQVTFGFWQTTQMTDKIHQIKTGGITPEVLQQLERVQKQLNGNSIERPSIEAALRLKLARTLSELGVPQDATRQYERALELLESDPSMPELQVTALTEYGTTLATSGKLKKAIALLERAVAMAEANPSILGEPAALPRCRMAYAQHQLGRYDDSLATYQQVLQELENLPVSHPRLKFQALLGRGNARRALGNREQALLELGAAVLHAEEHFGTIDDLTLGARHDLAIALLADKKAAPEAEKLLQSILDARHRTLGPTHVDTVACVLNLAFSMHRQGDFERSEALSTRYLAEAKKADLTKTVPIMKMRFNLGVAQMMRKEPRLAAAEAGFRSLVADAKTELPEGHWMTMAFHTRVGTCRLHAARASKDPAATKTILTEARSQLELAIAGLEKRLGAKNRQTQEAAKALIEVYERQAETKLEAQTRERFDLKDFKTGKE